MHEAIVFLIVWLGGCAIVAGVVVIVVNFDRIAAFVIDVTDAPICLTAQMVAALIHQSPAEWENDEHRPYAIRHGDIEVHGSCVRAVEVRGPQFGAYEPNAIERRIIWNAVTWRQRRHIQGLAHKALTVTTP